MDIIWIFLLAGIVLTAIMACWIRDNIKSNTLDIPGKYKFIIWSKWSKKIYLYQDEPNEVLRVKAIGECYALALMRFHKEYSQIIFLLTYVLSIIFWHEILS